MSKTAPITVNHPRGLWSLSLATPRALAPAIAGLLGRWAEQLLRSQLAQLRHGELTLVDGGRRHTFGQRTARCALSATLQVRDPRFYAETAFGGSVGAGESYMAGDWTCDDLTALVRILLHNRAVIDGVDGGWAHFTAPLRKLLHAAARNTRDGSRRNIGAHYDVRGPYAGAVGYLGFDGNLDTCWSTICQRPPTLAQMRL